MKIQKIHLKKISLTVERMIYYFQNKKVEAAFKLELIK